VDSCSEGAIRAVAPPLSEMQCYYNCTIRTQCKRWHGSRKQREHKVTM